MPWIARINELYKAVLLPPGVAGAAASAGAGASATASVPALTAAVRTAIQSGAAGGDGSAASALVRSAAFIPALQPLLGSVIAFAAAGLPAHDGANAKPNAPAAGYGDALAQCLGVLRLVRNACALSVVHQTALRACSGLYLALLRALPPLTRAAAAAAVSDAHAKARRDVVLAALQACVNAMVQNADNRQFVFDALLQPYGTADAAAATATAKPADAPNLLEALVAALPAPAPAAAASEDDDDGDVVTAWAEDVFALSCGLLTNSVMGSEKRCRQLLWRFDADDTADAKSVSAAAPNANANPNANAKPNGLSVLHALMRREVAVFPHQLSSDHKHYSAAARNAKVNAAVYADADADADGEGEVEADGSRAFEWLTLLWRELLRCSWSDAVVTAADVLAPPSAAAAAAHGGSRFGAAEWLLFLRIFESETRAAPTGSAEAVAAASTAIADQCVALVRLLLSRGGDGVSEPLRAYLQSQYALIGSGKALPQRRAATPAHPLLCTVQYAMQIVGNALTWHHPTAFVLRLNAPDASDAAAADAPAARAAAAAADRDAKSAAAAPNANPSAAATVALLPLPSTLVEFVTRALQWTAGQFTAAAAAAPAAADRSALAAAMDSATGAAATSAADAKQQPPQPQQQAGAFGMGVGRRLDPINAVLPYAFRTDAMRVMANVVYAQQSVADSTVTGDDADGTATGSGSGGGGSSGAVEVIMSHTYIDADHEPVLREWSIFALRNAIEASGGGANGRVGRRVRQYQMTGISADTQEQLSRIGMRAELVQRDGAAAGAGADAGVGPGPAVRVHNTRPLPSKTAAKK